MPTLMKVLRAQHIGVRQYRVQLSKQIVNKELNVLTFKGQPMQVVVPYEEMIMLLEKVEAKGDKKR